MSAKKILAISLAISILAFLVIFKFISCNQNKSTSTTSGIKTVLPVDVFLVRDTSIAEQFSTIGSLTANESVEIVSEISKKVTGIFMKEGKRVSKGQLLFKLDDSDILAEINTLKVEEELAVANEKRERALLDKGGISQETYDNASNRLKTIRAKIKVLETDLAKTEILAPFDGTIGLRHVSEGAWVTPETLLTDLHDLKKLKVIFTVPEKYSGDIRPGQKITVSTDYTPEHYSAIVDAFEPAVDIKTRTLKVQAILDNRHVSLIPGTSVDIDVALSSLSRSLYIRTSALIPSQKGYFVYLFKEGKAVKMPVKTGIRTQNNIQILKGLTAGDTLITTNLLRIRPGMPVMINTLQ